MTNLAVTFKIRRSMETGVELSPTECREMIAVLDELWQNNRDQHFWIDQAGKIFDALDKVPDRPLFKP